MQRRYRPPQLRTVVFRLNDRLDCAFFFAGGKFEERMVVSFQRDGDLFEGRHGAMVARKHLTGQASHPTPVTTGSVGRLV